MAKLINGFNVFLFICVLSFTACSKFDAVKSSIVVSNTLDSTSSTSASISVNIIILDKSLPPITSQGLCWGTVPNPTKDSSFKLVDSTNKNSFSFMVYPLSPQTTYYFRAYAVNKSGTIYGKQITLRTPASSPFSIGQFYAGGLIFYIDTTGNHGLVSDTTDISDSVAWHSGGNDTLIAGGTAIGTGIVNTAFITGHYNSDSFSAAWLCKNYTKGGYSDWFLPSKDELNLMRQNLYAKGFGNWSNATYWSSSEYIDAQGRYYAWTQYFTNGYQYYFKQYFPLSVRAVRAF